MKSDRAAVLSRVLQLGTLDQRLDEFLNREDTRQVESRIGGGTMRETLHIWRARAEINREDGHPLIGAAELLAKMESRTPQRYVEQVHLFSSDHNCTLFFEKASREFLGFVLIRRRSEAEEAARLARFQALTGSPHISADPETVSASRFA